MALVTFLCDVREFTGKQLIAYIYHENSFKL